MPGSYSLAVVRERAKIKFRLVGTSGKLTYLDRAAADPALLHFDYRLLSLVTLRYSGAEAAWPSLRKMAADLPGRDGGVVSERYVRESVARLRARGYLYVIFRPGQSSLYDPVWPVPRNSSSGVGVDNRVLPRNSSSGDPGTPVPPIPVIDPGVRSTAELVAAVARPEFDVEEEDSEFVRRLKAMDCWSAR